VKYFRLPDLAAGGDMSAPQLILWSLSEGSFSFYRSFVGGSHPITDGKNLSIQSHFS
jgi:hypothetical protein